MDAKDSAGRGDCIALAAAERDRAMIREYMRKHPKRWSGITPEVKQRVIDALVWALETARDVEDPKDPLAAHKVIASVTRTFGIIEAQNQKDDHQAEDKETPKVVEHRHYVVPPPRLLNGEP